MWSISTAGRGWPFMMWLVPHFGAQLTVFSTCVLQPSTDGLHTQTSASLWFSLRGFLGWGCLPTLFVTFRNLKFPLKVNHWCRLSISCLLSFHCRVCCDFFPPLNTVQSFSFIYDPHFFCILVCFLFLHHAHSSSPSILISLVVSSLSCLFLVWKSVYYKVESWFLFELSWKKLIIFSSIPKNITCCTRMEF